MELRCDAVLRGTSHNSSKPLTYNFASNLEVILNILISPESG